MARLASRGSIAAALVALAATAALAACGSPSEDGEAGVGFAGCEPEAVAHHLGGFLNAASARQDERVLRYLSPGAEFLRFSLDDRVGADGRTTSRNPRELHDSLVAALPKNHVAAMLAVEVGEPGPRAGEYADRAGPHETAAVEVAARIGGDRFLAGRFGVECEAGRIYAGAADLRRHLQKSRACGRAIGAGAEPLFCRVD